MSAPAPSPRASQPPSAAFVESMDPATGEVIGRFAAARTADIPEFFRRAREAQKLWAARAIAERCALLRRLRSAIFERRAEIAEAISRETGKPRVEALFAEVFFALDTVEFLSRQSARWLREERVPHHNWALKSKRGWLVHEPLGIVALITPWNYPLAIPLGQIAPALAAGNAVLVKPSELTPWAGSLIEELLKQAEAPVGLVQVLQGGREIGAAIIEAGPDKVFFTGSAEAGRRVAEACASKLIPSVLELGGKDAMLVLADANLERASSAAVWGGFTNCGQACLSVERVYVEQAVAGEFTGLCVAKTKKLRVGPPSDAQSDLGPMVRETQAERVVSQLHEAAARGAKILTGGEQHHAAGANFLEPAVVTNVDSSMCLMREETFGPVIAIQSVADAEEAVRLANDCEYGLAASVWTRNEERGRAIARQLRAGSVMVNDVASYYGIAEAPHGGRGASGWGRVHSRLGLQEMSHVKYIDEERLLRMAKPWWYGYSQELEDAADRMMEVFFAPDRKRRWMALLGGWRSLRPLFRKAR